MACALPVRPWDHPGPSGFRLSSSPENDSHSRVAPLWHFDATLASCPRLHRPKLCVASVDSMRPRTQAPRLKLATLQHIRTKKPHFSPLSKRPASVAMPPGSSTRRVWLPFQWPSAFQPLGISFNPQRSWV